MKKILFLGLLSSLLFSSEIEFEGSGKVYLNKTKITGDSFSVEEQNGKIIVSSGDDIYIINDVIYKKNKIRLKEYDIKEEPSKINLNGAVILELNQQKDKNELVVNSNGASILKINNIKVKELFITADGASEVHILKSNILKGSFISNGSSEIKATESKFHFIDKEANNNSNIEL